MTAARETSPQRMVDAFNHARQLLRVYPDHPAMIIDELMFMFSGRCWMVGGYFHATAAYYFEVAGVRSWSMDDSEEGARQALRRWLANAREAINTARQAAGAAEPAVRP